MEDSYGVHAIQHATLHARAAASVIGFPAKIK